MPDPKVSVIIPVFRVEKYIEKCARSLFNQTLNEMEFIFIDDCGGDNSIGILKEILNEFPERRSQVIIINNRVNRGVSRSRQEGLSRATGEYIIHCDPDDWVDEDMYEKLYTCAKENASDICGCDYMEETESGSIIREQRYSRSPIENAIAILDGKQYAALWCRLIKREFIMSQKASFEPGIRFAEDAHFVFPLHLATVNVSWVTKPFYHYRLINSSLTHSINRSHIYSYILVIKSFEKYCSGNIDFELSYQRIKTRAMQPLITQPNVYNPQRWIKETKNIPIDCFGSKKHYLSPWLIRHGLYKLNYTIIFFFRLVAKIKRLNS